MWIIWIYFLVAHQTILSCKVFTEFPQNNVVVSQHCIQCTVCTRRKTEQCDLHFCADALPSLGGIRCLHCSDQFTHITTTTLLPRRYTVYIRLIYTSCHLVLTRKETEMSSRAYVRVINFWHLLSRLFITRSSRAIALSSLDRWSYVKHSGVTKQTSGFRDFTSRKGTKTEQLLKQKRVISTCLLPGPRHTFHSALLWRYQTKIYSTENAPNWKCLLWRYSNQDIMFNKEMSAVSLTIHLISQYSDLKLIWRCNNNTDIRVGPRRKYSSC